ncbi:hypothetical protein QBK99_04125 [Corticibacterium sp. UT-5YL-CI-8]|nr:hypothetical protein [Tianweitania sp. UT-5YL-CI-8]
MSEGEGNVDHFRAFATQLLVKWATSSGRRNGFDLRRRTVRSMEKHRPSRFSWHLFAVSGAISIILIDPDPRNPRLV